MCKKTVSDILKIVSFMLIFTILTYGVSSMFFSEKVASEFKNNLQDAYAFLADAPDTIQIVGVGNSNLYSGFSPLDLWKQYGWTSTVCASVMQSRTDSLELLKLVFETQSPQIVLIETDMLYDHKPKKGNDMEQSNKLLDILRAADPKYFADDIESIFTVFKFHNLWKGKNRGVKSTLYDTHGYKYNTRVYKLKAADYMKKTTKSEPLHKRSVAQTDALLTFCKSKNAAVVLVSMPSPLAWNYERHNAVAQYAEERGVLFVDLNLHYREMELDMRTCFRDKGSHLNYSGAKAATAFLGEYIQGAFTLPAHSGDNAYQSWNADLKKFEASCKGAETDAERTRSSETNL